MLFLLRNGCQPEESGTPVHPVAPPLGGGILIYFSVRERAAEQGIIFRIPTPGQGIIFVKIGSMTGSIFVILTQKGRFRPLALCLLGLQYFHIFR